MNSMSQQGGFQNSQYRQQQSGSQSSNNFQPLGYVQSHYQGQPKQQGGFISQETGPVISHAGFSAGQQNQGMSSGGYSQNSHIGMNQNQNQYQNQPVISHVGYTANQDYQPQNNFSSQSGANQSQPVISHVGYTANQNYRSNSFNQSNSSSQYQPVISHVGYSAGSNQNQNQFSQQQGHNMNQQNQQFMQANAHTQQNPVYQATNSAANSGPVLSRLGYSSGSQSGSFQGRQNNFGGFQR